RRAAPLRGCAMSRSRMSPKEIEAGVRALLERDRRRKALRRELLAEPGATLLQTTVMHVERSGRRVRETWGLISYKAPVVGALRMYIIAKRGPETWMTVEFFTLGEARAHIKHGGRWPKEAVFPAQVR